MVALTMSLHPGLGLFLVLLGLDDLEEVLLQVELLFQSLLVGAHGLQDRLPLEVEDLLAGQARCRPGGR